MEIPETVAQRHAFLENYNPYSLQHTQLFQIFIASSSNTIGSSAEHEGNRDRRSFSFDVLLLLKSRVVVISRFTKKDAAELSALQLSSLRFVQYFQKEWRVGDL